VRGSIVLSFANVLSFARYCTLHMPYKYNQDFLELAGLRIGGDWNVDRTTAEILPGCASTNVCNWWQAVTGCGSSVRSSSNLTTLISSHVLAIIVLVLVIVFFVLILILIISLHLVFVFVGAFLSVTSGVAISWRCVR
jgi:hypothetical protein